MVLLSFARDAITRFTERVKRRRRLFKASNKGGSEEDFRSTAGSSYYCETTSSELNAAKWASSGTSTLASSMSSVSLSSSVSSPVSHNLRLEGWMYWIRYDAVSPRPTTTSSSSTGSFIEYEETKKHQTATKVYVVLRNEFLLLYRDNRRTARHNDVPLIQIAVERAGRAIDGAFHVFDPHGEEMELHLYHRCDEQVAHQWEVALEHAAELTHSYFATFELRVEDLARSSLYRGTLRDFRSQQRASFRQNAHERLASLRSSVLSSTVLSSSRHA